MADLDLVEMEGGTRLKLRVQAGARKNAILGAHGGALKLTVTAAPEKGRANRAVLELLAGHLGVAPSLLELVSGQTSKNKTVRIPLTADVVRERLSRAESPPKAEK